MWHATSAGNKTAVARAKQALQDSLATAVEEQQQDSPAATGLAARPQQHPRRRRGLPGGRAAGAVNAARVQRIVGSEQAQRVPSTPPRPTPGATGGSGGNTMQPGDEVRGKGKYGIRRGHVVHIVRGSRKSATTMWCVKSFTRDGKKAYLERQPVGNAKPKGPRYTGAVSVDVLARAPGPRRAPPASASRAENRERRQAQAGAARARWSTQEDARLLRVAGAISPSAPARGGRLAGELVGRTGQECTVRLSELQAARAPPWHHEESATLRKVMQRVHTTLRGCTMTEKIRAAHVWFPGRTYDDVARQRRNIGA